MARLHSAPVLVVSLAAGLTAQRRTLVVDPVAGPYFDLPAAVAASQPGDRIEVHAAAIPYSATTITHGLDVDAQPGATVENLIIQGLVPPGTVRIEGLAAIIWFDITNCQGAVHVHRVAGTFTMRITNSPQVALSRCTITGDYWGPWLFPAVYVESSRIVVVDGQLRGAAGVERTPGAAALSLRAAECVLIDTMVLGGAGGTATYCPSFGERPGWGGAGVTGIGTVVAVGSTQIGGGTGGVCPANPIFNGAPGAAAGPDVTLRLGPGATLTGAAGTPVLIAEPPLLSHPSELQQGTLASLGVATRPGDVVLLGLDSWNGWTAWPGNELPILLPLGTASLAGVAVADGAGIARFGLQVPVAPWIANEFAAFQAIAFDAQGAGRLSGPGLARIR